MELRGNLVDVVAREIYPAEVVIEGKTIVRVKRISGEFERYLIPGLLDAHIHIESSMLCPSRFAEVVVPKGTTSVIADPHEIANVLGIEGIEYMARDSGQTPLKVYLAAPSCVPATSFETSGAVLGPEEVDSVLQMDNVVALGEVMNFPGVVNRDKDVMQKIDAAKKRGKMVDGHAPMLSGDALKKYVEAGISTDHECTTLEEAREKAKLGMKIQIREGSASKNMKALLPLAKEYDCMLVSDDRHPEDLMYGHMDAILRKTVELGVDPVDALRMATVVPAEHYGLNSGAIQEGRSADIVALKSLDDFEVAEVLIDGKLVAKDGVSFFRPRPTKIRGTFSVGKIRPEDLAVQAGNRAEVSVRVIEAFSGQIFTKEKDAVLLCSSGFAQADVEHDVLHLAVVERYGHNNIGRGFVHGFGLKKGAMASSVAHDSHNIIVIGTSTNEMASAVNEVAKEGGIVAVEGSELSRLALPIAGLMSGEPVDIVAGKLSRLHEHAKQLGCKLEAPFMTLSFLSLLVIPELKLSDRGLFDSRSFSFVPVIKEDS